MTLDYSFTVTRTSTEGLTAEYAAAFGLTLTVLHTSTTIACDKFFDIQLSHYFYGFTVL